MNDYTHARLRKKESGIPAQVDKLQALNTQVTIRRFMQQI